MNNYIILLFFTLSISFSQNPVSIKEFNFYKSRNINELDLNNYFYDLSGIYLLKLINVDNVSFERTKKILVDRCDFEFDIKSSVNKISVEKCNDILNIQGELIVDENNYILTFKNQKFNYIEGEFTFWIYGDFNEESVSNNLNDGILREYYKDGNLKIEYNYDNGKKNGIQKKWHENKQLAINYNYNNGKLDGKQKKWYKNGNIQSEINYKNDILHGVSKYWYKNGQLKYTKIYENGILVKTLESYNFDGEPL
tara:strand:+ start:828 stop:1586 length:759 start_codon:yes stop_codon:yes gene_type:complete